MSDASQLIALIEDVNPDDVPARAGGQRVRVSAPILDAFLESGKVYSRIRASELPVEANEGETVEQAQEKRAKSLLSSLTNYAQQHQYPVKVFSRGGADVYLQRLDLDDDGNPKEWTPAEPKPRKAKADTNGDEIEVDDVENDEEYE